MVDIKQTIAVWRLTLLGIPPMIIIAIGAGTRAAALLKPLVFITAMIYYNIHNQFNAALMHAFQQSVKICHGTKIFHDIAVVAYVITVVVIRRAIDRIQPHRINAQALDIIQF